jgi:hypothetical protein
MSDAINRITRDLFLSVNTPDYPESEYIINPDLSLVKDTPGQYWKISGDSVIIMNETEKQAVDNSLVEQAAQASAKDINNIVADHTARLTELNSRIEKLEKPV